MNQVLWNSRSGTGGQTGIRVGKPGEPEEGKCGFRAGCGELERGSGHPIPVVERRVSAWVLLPDVTDSLDSVLGQNFREQPEVLQSVQGPNHTCGHQLWVKPQQDKSYHLPNRVARFSPRMRSSKGALSGEKWTRRGGCGQPRTTHRHQEMEQTNKQLLLIKTQTWLPWRLGLPGPSLRNFNRNQFQIKKN